MISHSRKVDKIRSTGKVERTCHVTVRVHVICLSTVTGNSSLVALNVVWLCRIDGSKYGTVRVCVCIKNLYQLAMRQSNVENSLNGRRISALLEIGQGLLKK